MKPPMQSWRCRGPSPNPSVPYRFGLGRWGDRQRPRPELHLGLSYHMALGQLVELLHQQTEEETHIGDHPGRL